MSNSSADARSSLAPKIAASQQRPRPLPLFLSLLRERGAANPQLMVRALEGLRRYQQAPRPPASEPMPARAERRGAWLRDYGGNGPPVLFIPSLINPPNILDLGNDRSLLRWLAGQGRRVWLLDWGWPDSRRDMDVAGHVAEILVPLMRELDEAPDLVGYCLGGTMAVAAAAVAPGRSLVTMATPWHFSDYPEGARQSLASLWSQVRPTVDRLRLLPMEALQSAFWNLDPERTIAKFEDFAEMEGEKAQAFIMLEDWANDGPPVSGAAAQELFEHFFDEDRTGKGRWQVGGKTIDPDRIDLPWLNIVSTSDRIVPAGAAPRRGERVEMVQGHVGMVVGSGRMRLWQALSDWLSRTATMR